MPTDFQCIYFKLARAKQPATCSRMAMVFFCNTLDCDLTNKSTPSMWHKLGWAASRWRFAGALFCRTQVHVDFQITFTRIKMSVGQFCRALNIIAYALRRDQKGSEYCAEIEASRLSALNGSCSTQDPQFDNTSASLILLLSQDLYRMYEPQRPLTNQSRLGWI